MLQLCTGLATDSVWYNARLSTWSDIAKGREAHIVISVSEDANYKVGVPRSHILLQCFVRRSYGLLRV